MSDNGSPIEFYHKNPRQITVQQFENLERWLEELGDLSGVVHDLNSNQIIGGNQRGRVFDINDCEIILVEEYDEPDVQGTVAIGYILWKGYRYGYRQVRWDEHQCEMANIVANRAGGDWDFDILANEFELDDLLNWGFIEHDLDLDLWLPEPPEDPGAQIDRAEELREKWGVETGQLWRLGEHRLICGDCTDAEVVKRVIGDDAPTLLVTDPPYGVLLDPEWRDRAGFNRLGKAEKPYDNDTKWDWSDAFELVPSLNICYVWHAEAHTIDVANGLKRIGFDILHQIIWDKQMAAFTRAHYWHQHEPCWYGFKSGHSDWVGKRGLDNSTVWSIPSPKRLMSGSKEEKQPHPTQKPLDCMIRPIQNHIGNVYEPFLGSGTTLIACERLRRKCSAVEISPTYCAVAIQRWVDMTGGKPELITKNLKIGDYS